MVTFRATAAAGAVALALGGPLTAGILAVSSSSVAFAATTASTSSSCTKADVDVVSKNSNLTKVSVKLASGSESVSCDVSLHSYETQGPTWQTSGQQTFLGVMTIHLTTTAQTLRVPAPECFGQTELVIGTTRNDGVDGPVPHYPNGVFSSSATIATWHGGTACLASPSPSVSPTSTVSPTPSVLPTSTSTVTPSVLPTTTASPSPSPSVLGLTLTRPQQPTLPFTGAPVLAEVALGTGLLGAGTLCALYAWRRRTSSN